MFKNRSFQIKMIKDEKGEELEEYNPFEVFEYKVSFISDHVKENLFVLGGAVLAYVFADTLRQVAVELAKK